MNSETFISTTIVALDPGLSHTGYAVFKVTATGVSLLQLGSIITDKELDDDLRIRAVLDRFVKLLDSINTVKRLVVIEKPPETIYNQKINYKMIKVFVNMICARASAMFKVYGVLYTLMSYCYLHNTTYRLVPPRDWQAKKSERAGKDTKQWSLQEARKLLKSKFLIKQKVINDHESDAILIGIYAAKKIMSGSWSV